MDIRDKLLKYITNKAINQSEIARRVGMTKDQLSKTLRKKRTLEANEFYSICNALKITMDDLVNQ